MNKKPQSFNKFFIGFFIGLLVTVCSFCIFITINWSKFETWEIFLRYMKTWKMLSSVLSLCAIPNILFFFWSLNTKRYNTANGVIGITMITAIIIAILRMFF